MLRYDIEVGHGSRKGTMFFYYLIIIPMLLFCNNYICMIKSFGYWVIGNY